MKDYDVYIYKGFKEDEDFWNKCFEKENSSIEIAEEVRLNELRDTAPMEKLLWKQQKLKAKLGIK